MFSTHFQCVDLQADDVKNLFAPVYKGLAIENFLEKAYQSEIVMLHLPDKRDLHRVPRQYIINIMHSLLGEPIRIMVKEAVKARNDLVAENRNLLIHLDP